MFSEFHLLVYIAVMSDESQQTFRRSVSQADNQHEVRSSETSPDFQQTVYHYIAGDRTLHIHRCENLKFYIADSCLYLKHALEFCSHSCFPFGRPVTAFSTIITIYFGSQQTWKLLSPRKQKWLWRQRYTFFLRYNWLQLIVMSFPYEVSGMVIISELIL
jgi:hypothetical protein